MKKICLVIICVMFFGCRSSDASLEPSVEFTKIPMAEIGGTLRLEPIEGLVRNSRPEYKIILYTKSGEWYVQPFADKTFTEIQPDGKWSNITHLGTEYAALLVTPEFVPEIKTHILPEKSNAVIAVAVVDGTPLYWRTWWFRTLLILLGVFLLIIFLRLRFKKMANEMNVRFEERLAERTRIAQELHDSLLQGFVGISMRIDVAVDQLPDDSPAKSQLNGIVKTIGKVIEEGRNTVEGLRLSDNKDVVNLEWRFSQIRQNWDAQEKIDFRFVEKGSPRKLCPVIADEVFYISRESLNNAFHHSGASKIEVITEYAAENFIISIRDNGSGIESKIVRTGRKGHWGLPGIRERSQKISANLKISSRANIGTEVELSIPNRIAFGDSGSKRTFRWLNKLSPRGKQLKDKN